MRGVAAERFVVFNLRLLALSFAVVGILFIAIPNEVLDALTDLGDQIGDFAAAPHGSEQLWLALGFAYMVVIAGICVIAQADVVRYRPLLLLLAAGKAASSLASLGFCFFRPGFTSGASLAVAPDEQNAVAGMVTSVNGVAFIAAPALGVGLYGLSMPLPFLVTAALMLGLALWVSLRFRPSTPAA